MFNVICEQQKKFLNICGNFNSPAVESDRVTSSKNPVLFCFPYNPTRLVSPPELVKYRRLYFATNCFACLLIFRFSFSVSPS